MEREQYKQQFKELIAPFLESDLLKEIYKDEYVSICNIANTSYALFSYDMMCNGKDDFVGILFNGQYLEKVADNPQLLLKDFVNSDEKKKLNMMVPLNEKSFEIMKNMKKKTDISGPTNEINLELEEQLLAKNKSR